MPLGRSELKQAVEHLQAGDWPAAHVIDLPNARYWYGQAQRSFPADPEAANEIRALKRELGA